MPSLGSRIRLPRRRTAATATKPGGSRAYDEIMDELPDEDLAEDLDDTLDLYRSDSKPRCEEAEYLELLQETVVRMAREG